MTRRRAIVDRYAAANDWLESRPAVAFVLYVLSPVLAYLAFATVSTQSYADAIRHGLVFGVSFATVSILLWHRPFGATGRFRP